MGKRHFTVNVVVKEVTPAHEAKEYGKSVVIERDVSDVVSVTTRADTKSEAVEKAVRMLEAEGQDDTDV